MSNKTNFIFRNSVLMIGLMFALQIVLPNYSCALDKSGVCGTTDFKDQTIVAAAMAEPVDRLPRAEDRKPLKTIYAITTAYSSTVDQCDDTPFITANGSHVRDGIVATNMFPFGTKVRFPDLYGNKVFSVEDRMHPRFSDRFDIWFETREEAIQFGAQYVRIEIFPAD